MKKKTKTTQETASDATMTGTNTTNPNAPSWVTDLAGQLSGQIPGVKTSVAGLSGLQQDAVNGLSGQSFGGMFGDAAGLAKSAATGFDDYDPSALGGVQSWLNPFLGGVVDATSADLDANDARTRAQQDLNIARAGAFGGSGAALTKSLTESELERARATTLGGLRMGAFDSAAGNSQQDKSRELQGLIAASNANSGAATQLGALGSTGIGLQADLGGTQRDIQNQQNNSGIADLVTQLGLFGDLSPIMQLLTGQTTTTSGTSSQRGTASGTSSTSDPMGSLSSLLQGLGSAAQGAGAMMG